MERRREKKRGKDLFLLPPTSSCDGKSSSFLLPPFLIEMCDTWREEGRTQRKKAAILRTGQREQKREKGGKVSYFSSSSFSLFLLGNGRETCWWV